MSKRHSPQFDIDFIKSAARVRGWPIILAELAGIDIDYLDGQHHPCPKCQGSNRFRFIDPDTGACFCNQCFSRGNGTGFDAICWMTSQKFADVLVKVADYLGIKPSQNGSVGQGGGKSKSSKADPAEHLVFEDWNEELAGLWCMRKPPIIPAAILAAGGRIARYRQKYTVIALPIWGEKWRDEDAAPVGYCLYNVTGGKLPLPYKDRETGKWKEEMLKLKLTAGSQPGIICDRQKLISLDSLTLDDGSLSSSAVLIWKMEGPSDLLSLLSLADLPSHHSALTNANGAKERPAAWVIEIFKNRIGYVIHDADQPGEDGAAGWVDERGKKREGWAEAIAEVAKECRHVRLPFEIRKDHGMDLRDFLNEDFSSPLPVPQGAK